MQRKRVYKELKETLLKGTYGTPENEASRVSLEACSVRFGSFVWRSCCRVRAQWDSSPKALCPTMLDLPA